MVGKITLDFKKKKKKKQKKQKGGKGKDMSSKKTARPKISVGFFWGLDTKKKKQ
mgnify:CR=1 FL=1